MAWVIEQQLKVGSEQEFSHLAKQITEAITKAGWPVHYTWNQVIAGTSAPTFTVVIPSNNWAGMKGPEEPFEAMSDAGESNEPPGSEGIDRQTECNNRLRKQHHLRSSAGSELRALTVLSSVAQATTGQFSGSRF